MNRLASRLAVDYSQSHRYVQNDQLINKRRQAVLKDRDSELDAINEVTMGVSKSRENVRLSVQHKCHSVRPGWYQMTTLRKPPVIVALEYPRHPGIA